MNFKVVVLASGTGSLFQSLLQHQSNYQITALITDSPTAPALKIAKSHQINTEVCETDDFMNRWEWNEALLNVIEKYSPNLVVSAGFMKILGDNVVEALKGKLINIHPSLLPAFPGAHAVKDALSSGVKKTGTTIHFVDRGVDTGKVIAQREIEIRDGDTVETLHERIKQVERMFIVEVVESFAKKEVV